MKMNFDRINSGFILSYKLIGVTLLALCAVAVVSYATLFLFYSFNRGWAAPITLSPSQERVLSVRPQVTMLEAGLDKTKIELSTAKAQVVNKTILLEQLNQLLLRIDNAHNAEAYALKSTNAAVSNLLESQRQVLSDTEKMVNEAERLEALVQAELASRLITRDQAAVRLLNIQSARIAAVNARAQSIALAEQARQARASSETLTGGATSLTAAQSLYQRQQLRALRAQVEIDLATAKATVEALTKTATDGEKVLNLARTSPYHQAMERVIHLGFMPYDNLGKAKVGSKVYDCYLHIVMCREVGKVVHIYEPEEYARHPLLRTDLKGKVAEIKFDVPSAANSRVVFIGNKPLFL